MQTRRLVALILGSDEDFGHRHLLALSKLLEGLCQVIVLSRASKVNEIVNLVLGELWSHFSICTRVSRVRLRFVMRLGSLQKRKDEIIFVERGGGDCAITRPRTFRTVTPSYRSHECLSWGLISDEHRHLLLPLRQHISHLPFKPVVDIARLIQPLYLAFNTQHEHSLPFQFHCR